MAAILSFTIISMVGATVLYTVSQNTNSGLQAAMWQQALDGAESAGYRAITALNKAADGDSNAWAGWYSVALSGGASPPTTKPSGGTPLTAGAISPSSATNAYYYFIPPDITLSQGEGNNTLSSWVTVDTGGTSMPLDLNGKQWYRIRAAGQANGLGLKRVSNQRLDNALRNGLSLFRDRKAGTNLAQTDALRATRNIEVIMKPLPPNSSSWPYGVLLRGSISLSGGSFIDSFDSTDPLKSTTGRWDPVKRQSHGDVASLASGNSDFRNMFVYGSLSYSGPPVKNTTNVTGTISTPFSVPAPTPPPSPQWIPLALTYQNKDLTSGQTITISGTQAAPTRIKASGSGNLNLSGSNILTLSNPGGIVYGEIWITGKMTISGSAQDGAAIGRPNENLRRRRYHVLGRSHRQRQHRRRLARPQRHWKW